MAKQRMVWLYACKQCKILLITIDKRFFVYERATMDSEGKYSRVLGEDDEEFDRYLCPLCSNTEYDSFDAHGEMVGTPGLEKIELTQSACEELFRLHKKLKEANTSEEDSYAYDVGIPLSNIELKQLLTEHMI